jgi:hypothetical protein
MSSDREETDATKPYTEHTNVVQEDSSIGAKAGQGVSYVVLTLVHGALYAHLIHQWSDEGPSWYESSAICVLLHLLFFLKTGSFVRDRRNYPGPCHRPR